MKISMLETVVQNEHRIGSLAPGPFRPAARRSLDIPSHIAGTRRRTRAGSSPARRTRSETSSSGPNTWILSRECLAISPAQKRRGSVQLAQELGQVDGQRSLTGSAECQIADADDRPGQVSSDATTLRHKVRCAPARWLRRQSSEPTGRVTGSPKQRTCVIMEYRKEENPWCYRSPPGFA